MSSIKTRPSPSLVIAMLALFVGLGGTTFAVQRSYTPPSPKAEAAKKVKRGPAGPRGPRGLQGLQGLQGMQGGQGLQGIPGPTFADFAGGDSPPSPYEFNVFANGVTTPVAGRLLVIGSAEVTSNCNPPGAGWVGLYLDGDPVPGTRRTASTTETLVVMVGVTPAAVPAGLHEVALGDQCFAGTSEGFGADNPNIGAVLLGS